MLRDIDHMTQSQINSARVSLSAVTIRMRGTMRSERCDRNVIKPPVSVTTSATMNTRTKLGCGCLGCRIRGVLIALFYVELTNELGSREPAPNCSGAVDIPV